MIGGIIIITVTAIAEPAFLKISNILSTARAFSSIAIAGIGVLMGVLGAAIGNFCGLAMGAILQLFV